MESTSSIRIAQTVGILASAGLAASSSTFSFATIPALLQSPTPLLQRQWRTVFTTGKTLGPPFALLACASFGYLAYAVPRQRRSYALAAVLPLSIIPFTIFLFDGPVNQVLMREAEKQTLGDAELRELVTNWGWWNGVRCLIPMVGAVVGLWTALE